MAFRVGRPPAVRGALHGVLAAIAIGCAGDVLPEWTAPATGPVALTAWSPTIGPEPVGGEALPLGCPYRGVHLAVSTNGAPHDLEVAERVRLAYGEYLGRHGFALVESPESAYWSAFSMVTATGDLSSTFAWSVYMMATQDLAGHLRTPLRFAAEEDQGGDLSGYMLLREVRLRDLESEARRAAEATASALLPHASSMCVVWSEDEALREELAQEILRIQQERRLKRLDLEVSPPSDS